MCLFFGDLLSRFAFYFWVEIGKNERGRGGEGGGEEKRETKAGINEGEDAKSHLLGGRQIW